MRRTRVSALLLVAVLTAALAGTAVAQPEDQAPAAVTVVHGIPDATVDVYVNGALALEDFEPGTVTDAIELPAGTYDLAVYPADADPDSTDPVVAAEDVAVAAGLNASVVAHLTEDAEPALAVFVNDTDAVEGDTARVAVRHTAAAPAVDVFVNGEVAIADLANPDEAVAELPADSYEVAVGVTGAPIEDAVLGPIDLELPADTLTIVYAVFSAADGDLTVLSQQVALDAQDQQPDPDARPISRLEGPTRIDTAVAISQRAFADGSGVVYLASSHTLADALAGGTLTDGPVLLVPECGDLPAVVAAEIDRLGAEEIIGLGGVAAICDDILVQASTA